MSGGHSTATRLSALLCWALVAACQDPGPDWIEVAALPAVEVSPAAKPGAFLQHTQRLEAADWTPAPLPGVWMAALEIPGVGTSDAAGGIATCLFYQYAMAPVMLTASISLFLHLI